MATQDAPTQLATDLKAAQTALLAAARAEPTRHWKPSDLRERTQNGWSGAIMMAALSELVNNGTFVLQADRTVTLLEPRA